jgi:hypothetical protein
LGAVQAERAKRKEEKQKREAAEQRAAQLEEKAKRYDEAAQYLEQAKPYIEKAKADLQREKTQQQPPKTLTPQQAESYARQFDLYKADGSPDVDRAEQIASFHAEQARQIAQQTVQQHVAPLVQTEAQRKSAALYQRYLSAPEVNGVKIDARFLAEAWNSVPDPAVIADNPALGEVLYRVALANQMMSGAKPVTAPPPVVQTESIGTGGSRETSLSGLSEKFQQASGMKPADFRKTRDAYAPGQPNSLE